MTDSDLKNQLVAIETRLSNIENQLNEYRPLLTEIAVLNTRIDHIEQTPSEHNLVQSHIQTLEQHSVRIDNVEKSIETLYKWTWQIVAATIILFITVVANYIVEGK